MANAYVANGAAIYRSNGDSPETFTRVPNLTSMTPIGQVRGLIETSHLASTSREYLKTMPDGQEMKLVMQYDPEDDVQANLFFDMRSERALSFQVVLPWVSPAALIDFRAQVLTWSITTLDLDSVATLEVTMKPTGDFTFSNHAPITPPPEPTTRTVSLTLDALLDDGGAAAFPFDDLSAPSLAALYAAYSMRRMTDDYVGPLIRVGRSSDAAEQDFGAGINVVSPSLVATFLGGSNGYITKFYDQVGANDLVQASPAAAPAFVASGIGGFPSADFNGTSHYMEANGVAAGFTGADMPMSAFFVGKSDTYTGVDVMLAFGSTVNTVRLFSWQAGGNIWQLSRRDDASGTVTLATTLVLTEGDKVFGVRFSGTTATVSMNGNPIQNMNAAAMNVGQLTLDRFHVGASVRGPTPLVANFYDGKFSELVMFNADIGGTQAEVLNANERAFYGAPILGLFAPTATQQLPDSVGGVAGEGFTCTGLARHSNGTDFWIGNIGRAHPADVTPLMPTVVHVNSTGSTNLGEISVQSAIPGAINQQGVAHDADTSLWLADPTASRVYHMSQAGVDLGGTLTISGANGVAKDEGRNCLWIIAGANLLKYSLTGTLLATVATGLPSTDVDMVYVEESTGLVWITSGANGSAGTVRAYDPATNKMGVKIYRFANTLAIEGVVIEGTAIYLTHDGYFHSAAPLHNQFQTYARVR